MEQDDTDTPPEWALEECPDGFVVQFHGERGLFARAIASVMELGTSTAYLVLLAEAGQSLALLFGGVIGTVPGLWRKLRRTWKPGERLFVGARRVEHSRVGRWKDELRSFQIGHEMGIEREPHCLANGLVRSTQEAASALSLHTNGHTVSVGLGLGASEADRLLAELQRRMLPERLPVPGRTGVVRAILDPVETGGVCNRRYAGQQWKAPLGAGWTLPLALLIPALMALVIGGVFAIARALSGEAMGEVEFATLVFGLIGSVAFAPRRGLVARRRRRQIAAARDRDTGRPREPWTWHGRWRTGHVRHTALRRLVRTRAAFWVPVFVGAGAWGGPPLTVLMIVLYVAIAWVAVLPMSVFLWHLAFSGTIEVGAAAIPLVPGERAEIRFALSRGAAPFESIAFRLVRAELRQSGPLRPRLYWTTHEGIYHLPPDTPPPGPNEEVPTFFDIPADAGGTDEDAAIPVRWFLEVRGVTAAGPYIDAFQVPVFDPVPDAATGDGRNTRDERKHQIGG